jgi:hypothetical protein
MDNKQSTNNSENMQPGNKQAASTDYYLDENGLLVFTKEYHLKRGYCCKNACRHCPYQPEEK